MAKLDVKHCAGCEDDFYNGKNPYGVQECWMRETAKLIMRKRVPIDMRPPWDMKSERLPDCYRQKGYVMVRPEIER